MEEKTVTTETKEQTQIAKKVKLYFTARAEETLNSISSNVLKILSKRVESVH